MDVPLPVCRYVKSLMKEAGLAIREDPMGNIYGRMQGNAGTAGEFSWPVAASCCPLLFLNSACI